MDVCVYLVFRKSAESERALPCVAFDWVEPDETIMFTAKQAESKRMEALATADELVRAMLKESAPEEVLPWDMYCLNPGCQTRVGKSGMPMRDLLSLKHATQMAIEASADGARVKAHYATAYSCGAPACEQKTVALLQAHGKVMKTGVEGVKFNTCNKCGKVDVGAAPRTWKRCARCKLAMYCSVGCAQGDWRAHKTMCVDTRK
jgi:hypothetical protein